MREVGLLEVGSDGQRRRSAAPSTCYSLAADAPSLGLEPPPFPMLARHAAAASPPTPALDGRGRRPTPGATRAGPTPRAGPSGTVPASRRSSTSWPARVRPRGGRATTTRATVAFAHCPFRDLAEAHPDLVCGLHRGLRRGLGRRPSAASRSSTFRTAGRPYPVPGRARSDRRPPVAVGSTAVACVSTAGGPPVITLTDNAAVKVKDLIRPRATTSSRCGSPSVPAGAPASATRCSSTPTSPTDDLTAELRRRQGRGRPVQRPAAQRRHARLQGRSRSGAGFAIDNPNAQRTCGCGQSFS